MNEMLKNGRKNGKKEHVSMEIPKPDRISGFLSLESLKIDSRVSHQERRSKVQKIGEILSKILPKAGK